jgi:LacI family transcriptional regulator
MPNNRRNHVTITDVAQHAGVSAMTVSRVVNNRGQISKAMRERVYKAMHELDYKPNRIARSLASNQTFKIGVTVPDIASVFFTVLLESIEYVLWKHNYYMVLSNTGKSDRREQDVLDIFEQDRVDGVLVFGSHLNCEQLTDLLRNHRAAVVFNSEVDPEVAGQILIDEQGAIELAVQHLMDTGRTHLGYVGVERRTYSMRERKRAFESVVARLSDRLNGWTMDINEHNPVTNLPQYLAAYPQTNGIVCFNDEAAADVLMILADIGKKVPEEIGVIGYDDTKLAQWVTPRLTTIRLNTNISQLGELAARLLLERIEGKVDKQSIVLSPQLIIRDSTRP